MGAEQGRGRALLAFAALAGAWGLGCADVSQTAQKVQKAAEEARQAALTPSLSCDAPVEKSDPVGCISGVLRCGSVIEGTTEGGESSFDDAFYSDKFCFPAGDDHGGPERVYRLEAAAYTSIDILLQSDCVDLDVAAIAYVYDGRCPSIETAVPECEAQNRRGGDHITIQTFNNPRDYLVAVDGKARQTGTFRLTVACEPIVRHE